MPLTNPVEADDAAFATQLLALLRDPVSDIPLKLLNKLKLIGGVEDPSQESLDIADVNSTIATLLARYPHLAVDIPAHNHAACCMLPLWIWAREPGAKPDEFAHHCLRWSKLLTSMPTTQLRAVVQSLNISYALRDELSPSSFNNLLDMWQDGPAAIAFWRKNSMLYSTELEAWSAAVVQTGRLHEHGAAIGVQEKSRQGMPSRYLRWSQSAGNALKSSTLVNQHIVVTAFLSSPLSKVSTLRLAKLVGPEVWAYPDVAQKIKPLLPASEIARWSMLPLTKYSSAKRIKELMREYCPEHTPIMESLLTEQDWESLPTVSSIFRQFSTKKMAPEMPHDVGNLFDTP